MKRVICLMLLLTFLCAQAASAEDGTVLCSTQEELQAALADESVHTITLTNAIEISGYISAEVSRPVLVDMGPYGISFAGQFSGLAVYGPVHFKGEGDAVPLFTLGFRQNCFLDGGTIEATADHAAALFLASGGKLTNFPMHIRANGENSIAVKSEGDITLCFVTIEADGPGGIGVQADGTIDVALSEITAGEQALAGSDVIIYSSLVAANGLTYDSLPLRAAIGDTLPGSWYYGIDEAIALPDSVHLQFSGGAETVFYDPSLEIIWDMPEITGTGPYEALGYVDSVFDRFGVENLNPIRKGIHVYDREGLYLFVDDAIPFYHPDHGTLSLVCLTGEHVSGMVTAWISQDDGETFAPMELVNAQEIHEGPVFFVELAEVFLDPDETYQIYIQLQAESGVMESNMMLMSVEDYEWIIAFGGDRNGTGRNPDTKPPNREEFEPALPEKEEEQAPGPQAPGPQAPDPWPHEAELLEENEEEPFHPEDLTEIEEQDGAPPLSDDDTAADTPDTETPADQLPMGNSTPDEAMDEQVSISADNPSHELTARGTDMPATPAVTEASDPGEETVQSETGQQSPPAETAIPPASDTVPPPSSMGDAEREAVPQRLSSADESSLSDQDDNSAVIIATALSGLTLLALGGMMVTGLRRRIR